MRIAVTGGMGFIGSQIVDDLVNQGHDVYVVDFWKDLISRYERARLPIMDELYRILPRVAGLIDPFDFVLDEQKAVKPEIIVHAGAVVDTMDLGSDDLFCRNVQFTQRLVKNASDDGSDIIFMSSAAVYGNDRRPNNPYGLSKALGEQMMLRAEGISTVSLRLFNVFGRNEHHKGTMASVPWKIAQAFEKGSKFELHSPLAQRDFIPCTAVSMVVCDLVQKLPGTGHSWRVVYDVGTGAPMSFEDLVDEIASAKKYTGRSPIEIVSMPSHLEGRYQFYTCAGKNGVENIGGKIGTSQGIRSAYGVDC
jgi:ADP-L-glycero-D-manno-heptose 6-epimerase